jgi:5-methylcytosine-specific restriction endonuclease McrA
MSRYDGDRLRAIFDKANGCCHLCGRTIAFSNYGNHGARGAWEVDHSKPVAEGGTDHLNNLFPAHTSCNRSKQDASSRSSRKENGRTRAPLSAAAIERARFKQAMAGAFSGGLLGVRLGGPVGFWIGVIAGGVAAYSLDPEA